MQRLFARFQATCVSVQTQAAVVEAASLDAASEEADSVSTSLEAASEEADSVSTSLEAASEEAATEEDTASENGKRRGGERSKPAASGHTGSQSQSNNSNSNILEFHIYNLLVSQKISPQRALCTGPVCKAIF